LLARRARALLRRECLAEPIEKISPQNQVEFVAFVDVELFVALAKMWFPRWSFSMSPGASELFHARVA
jgi:hypothetical protein